MSAAAILMMVSGMVPAPAREKPALALHLTISDTAIRATLTNISPDFLEVDLRVGPVWSEVPWLPHMIIKDQRGRQKGPRVIEDYQGPRKEFLTLLAPGQSIFGEKPLGATQFTFALRKERYRIMLADYGEYYSLDGKKHGMRIVSNTVALDSKIDAMKEFCSGRYLDGIPGISADVIQGECPKR